jgi:hypothetical protein
MAEFMQDVDGSTSELLKNANVTLMPLDQKTLIVWANNCAEQGRQVMHLAAEAYELLTPDTWTLEDCDEYMAELDEELKRFKDLFKQFSTDRLNLAMRRKAAKLTNNVNTEVTKARKIVQRLITIHEAGVTSDEEQEDETSRPEMGNVGGPVDASDGSGRYVRLAQEAQTPRPRCSRPGKENDGEAVPTSQLPPRISLGLTVRISGQQTGAVFPVDTSTPQEGERRSLPIIYLDDVSNTGHSPSRNTREEGRNGAEEDVRFGDNWDLPSGSGTRTWTDPVPPSTTQGGGALPIRGRIAVGVTATLVVRLTPNPAQNDGAMRTLASATKTKVVNPARVAPVQDKGVTGPIATQTAPDLNRGKGTMGASPEADATAVGNLVAPAKGAGAWAQEEMRKRMTTVTPTRMRIKEARETTVEWPLLDAVGHPTGKTSEAISLGMRSRARSCRA